jgi:hypothetical protein
VLRHLLLRIRLRTPVLHNQTAGLRIRIQNTQERTSFLLSVLGFEREDKSRSQTVA